MNLRDFAVLREVIRPEFQRHDLAGALPEVSGTEGAVELIHLLLQAMPDLHVDLKQAIATEDRVAAHIAVSGTHQGELFGVPGTGKRVEINGINPGIPDDVAGRVFDPVVTSKAPGEGTGLGLSIAHLIVTERHDGQVAVASRPDRTCFRVQLPLTTDGRAAQETTATVP